MQFQALGWRDQCFKKRSKGDGHLSIFFWCALFICLPNKDKRFHPTQKPVELMEYLIRTYTHPGEVVLDNCIGSGSTAVAAIRSGRHFVGIERDPQYAQLAQERCLEECDKIGIVA